MSEAKLAALEQVIEGFISLLQRRHLEGSLQCALQTAKVMREVIAVQRFPTAVAMLDAVRAVGIRIQAAKPLELAIGNTVRRIMHSIRKQAESEHEELVTDAARGSMDMGEPDKANLELQLQQVGHLAKALARKVSLHNLLDSPMGADLDLLKDVELPVEIPADDKKSKKGKARWSGHMEVIDTVNELIEEIMLIEDNIARQAQQHIHANELVLTHGFSPTCESFFKEAAAARTGNSQFQLLVAEAAPNYKGHKLAATMAKAGVQTTVITDAAVFAMMARVNKVIVGAHAVLANGGIIGNAGVHALALAAKAHSVPFVVLVGLHKLSPLFPHDPWVTFNDFRSAEEVVDLGVLGEQRQSAEEGGPTSSVTVPNPKYDFVPPDLISLLITDAGGHTPSYVYRLLAEYYTREDYTLSKELLDSITHQLVI